MTTATAATSFMSMQRSHGDDGELLKVQLHHSVHKHLRILTGITVRYINNVGLQDNGVNLPFLVKLIYRRNRPVVIEPVLAPDNPKAQYMLLVIQNLQPLGARRRREPRNDGDFSYASNPAVAFHIASFDEMLVFLWVFEASDERPYGMSRSVDPLRY